ncbi:MAG TPA: ATP-binding protein, partial [Methylomirabilota bacterium]|nr:ATP-binding protein [Methylomirabilota bacterium]
VVNTPGIPPSEFEEVASLAVKPALQGEEKADTVQVAGKVYDVIAIPAYDSDNKQIGALALGSELGDAAVQEFSKLTQGQIALLANGHVIAASLPGLEANAQFTSFFKGAMPANDDPAANIKSIVFNGVHYDCIAGHFVSLAGNNNLGYVLFSSSEQSLAEKRAAQHILAAVSLLAILFSAAMVWFFVNKATKPFSELRQGAEAVGRGDFNQRILVTSRDECGQLALVFNRMTENLQQSHSQLEKTVETLKNTQEHLVQREKLSAIGEFVAGVAHELNNPMAAVVGFSELLKKETQNEKCQLFSDRIFQAAMRCKKIVQSLLSFARRDKPRREPVSMNDLVETVLDIVGYSLRTGNIEMVRQFDPNLPMVMADSHQMQQVLLNIIGNAQQAMEASQPYGRIKITTETCLPNIRVTIEDNGPGIAQENMPRLFDPFFTTKEVGKGTGLGLSLCYGFVKEHGGSITPSSELGKGATFVIELPAMEQVTVQSRPVETKKLTNGNGKRILIIDDEEPILNMIREDLSSLGYKVDVTTDGEKALRELEDKRFDLAICDWKMPGLGGRQIYEQLRDTNPKICGRMIFITGDVVNPQIRRFMENENRPCITKPFTLSEFHTAVENILDAV